jgi:hypothetical protein
LHHRSRGGGAHGWKHHRLSLFSVWVCRGLLSLRAPGRCGSLAGPAGARGAGVSARCWVLREQARPSAPFGVGGRWCFLGRSGCWSRIGPWLRVLGVAWGALVAVGCL